MGEFLVKDLMNKDVATLNGGDTVLKAIDLMNDRGIGSVIVTESGKAIGIFSERDVQRLIRKLALKAAYQMETNVSEVKLGEVMSKPLVTTSPNATISEAYETMIRKKIRHLPVAEGDRLVGVLAERDIFRAKRIVV